jgi:hypothetical protein
VIIGLALGTLPLVASRGGSDIGGSWRFATRDPRTEDATDIRPLDVSRDGRGIRLALADCPYDETR